MVVGNKLKVTVINGRDLKCKDSNKDVCPYCLLQTGSSSHQTKSISNNSNPQWNEDFVFDVDPGCEVLSFSIWHKNTLRKDVVIGYAFVDFGSCKTDEKTTINIQLQGIYSGEIKLSILPIYETTASKVVRLEREVSLLRYELANHTSRNELLTTKVSELTATNEELTKTNKLLEHERNTLLEYDILSCTNPRGNQSNNSLGYDIVTCTSPRTRQALDSSVVDSNTEQHVNGTAEQNFDDEFDIISERDIENSKTRETSEKLVDNATKDGETKQFTFTSKCEHEQSVNTTNENVEGEMKRSHNKHEPEDECDEVNGATDNVNILNDSAIASRVNCLEDENTELKIFIRQMHLETGDELDQLIDELNSEKECQYCRGAIRSKIAQLRRIKYQNDAKITLLKEVISTLTDSVDKVETNEFDENDFTFKEGTNVHEEREGIEIEQTEEYEDGDVELLSIKAPHESDVLSIKEYFWDEYLPISTGHSNNDSDNSGKMYDDLTNIVDGITDDIDDFIKNNYLFHNSGSVGAYVGVPGSDPGLFTKSQMLEENEHFKEMNIRLIKENEEINECVQLLQVQVQNMKKIQSILFDQLIQRAPTCMRNIIDNFSDYSQAMNDDQVTLYKSHLGNVFDEILTFEGGGGDVEFKDTSRKDNGYKFPSSLLMHHHISAT